MTVAEAQTLCLKQGTPFYSYRLPGERESVFGAQLDGEVAPFRQVGEQGKGFILVPFAESEEVPAWFIRGDITFREVTTDIEIRTGLSGTMGLTDIKPGQEPDISWEEYESQVAAMVRPPQGSRIPYRPGCRSFRLVISTSSIRPSLPGRQRGTHRRLPLTRACCKIAVVSGSSRMETKQNTVPACRHAGRANSCWVMAAPMACRSRFLRSALACARASVFVITFTSHPL